MLEFYLGGQLHLLAARLPDIFILDHIILDLVHFSSDRENRIC
jgi:hypothetical protein